jgi:hypothetical protein
VSHRATIQGIMRQVPRLIGETDGVTIRTRTSNIGVDPVAWSATQVVTAQFGQEQETIERDEVRNSEVRRLVAVMIYPDTYTFVLQGAATVNELPIGAEVKRSDGLWWAVLRRLQATSGLKRVLVGREFPRQITADRGGRVL